MATSGEPPTSNQYTNEKLKASLRRTEQRLASARSRRARQRWTIFFCSIALVAVIALVWGAVWVRQHGPSAPLLIVTWPKPKFRQKVASGSAVLVRPGQSFTVTVENASQWKLQWHSSDIVNDGAEMRWLPTGANSTLKAYCRATGSGWQRFIAWLWPMRQVNLHSRVAATTGYRSEVTPPSSGLWIYPLVFAGAPVRWDERVLPKLMPNNGPTHAKAGVGTDAPRWTIVSAFAGKPVPYDEGTYARLWSQHPEADLTALCRRIAAEVPTASIKFVVRLSNIKGQPPEGILRLAFDGKGQRGGWVKSPGESTASVIEWWADNPIENQLAPTQPVLRRR